MTRRKGDTARREEDFLFHPRGNRGLLSVAPRTKGMANKNNLLLLHALCSMPYALLLEPFSADIPKSDLLDLDFSHVSYINI